MTHGTLRFLRSMINNYKNQKNMSNQRWFRNIWLFKYYAVRKSTRLVDWSSGCSIPISEAIPTCLEGLNGRVLFLLPSKVNEVSEDCGPSLEMSTTEESQLFDCSERLWSPTQWILTRCSIYKKKGEHMGEASSVSRGSHSQAKPSLWFIPA